MFIHHDLGNEADGDSGDDGGNTWQPQAHTLLPPWKVHLGPVSNGWLEPPHIWRLSSTSSQPALLIMVNSLSIASPSQKRHRTIPNFPPVIVDAGPHLATTSTKLFTALIVVRVFVILVKIKPCTPLPLPPGPNPETEVFQQIAFFTFFLTFTLHPDRWALSCRVVF